MELAIIDPVLYLPVEYIDKIYLFGFAQIMLHSASGYQYPCIGNAESFFPVFGIFNNLQWFKFV